MYVIKPQLKSEAPPWNWRMTRFYLLLFVVFVIGVASGWRFFFCLKDVLMALPPDAYSGEADMRSDTVAGALSSSGSSSPTLAKKPSSQTSPASHSLQTATSVPPVKTETASTAAEATSAETTSESVSSDTASSSKPAFTPATSGTGVTSSALLPTASTEPTAQKTEAQDGILSVPVTVGAPMHRFNTLLGGVIWTASRARAREMAKALPWFQGNVLLDIKAQANGFGYRFDLNSWEQNTIEYGYYAHNGTDEQEPITLDDTFQIFGAPNVKFILHVPVPNDTLELGSARFAWQTPKFYGAQLQYLFGTADGAETYNLISSGAIDFFASTTGESFNWANLRAYRGHPEPYRAEAIILGEEPYHIEGWSAGDGAGFGARANEYRIAMRTRGVTLPYGVHVSQLNPTDRGWFRPLIAALPTSDGATYLDLYHHYSFASGSDDWLRSFPVARRVEGFTNWWVPKETWRADYSKFLWIIEDVTQAMRDLGVSRERMRIGFGEHGITIASPFRYNDMTGALHFSLWLSEIMRYGTEWDSMWVLLGEGFSTALVQLRDGALVKTPAFFAYELANRLKGMTYLETTAYSPEGETTNPEGHKVTYPYVVIRVFENASGGRELFVINQHRIASARLLGFDGWRIDSWEELSGGAFESGNPLDSSGSLPVATKRRNIQPNDPLLIAPISINRIVLSKK